ncbi:MAG: hypothetical protein KY475_08130 [Planctomycetes bacterium]|nr:hypothetical protein [Planctomycetota bacterium]
MKLLSRSLVAAFAVAFSGVAADYAAAGNACGCGDICNPCWNACGDCCYNNCGAGCCDGAGGIGFFGEAELLFLRYHRADGVRIGGDAGENTEFDFEPAQRYTLGLSGPGGFGARVRWFEYDHFEGAENAAAGDGIGVDLWTIDVEGFEAFELNDVWALEVSGGLRFTNFREQMIDVGEGDDRRIGVDALGGIVGLEARRSLGLGLVYARARFAVVQGDKQLFNQDGQSLGPVVDPVTGALTGVAPAGAHTQNVQLLDTTQAMLELAIGSEVNYELANGAVLFARSGLEWQHWYAFSSAFNQGGEGFGGHFPPLLVQNEGLWDGDSDVGLGGFTFSAGVSY